MVDRGTRVKKKTFKKTPSGKNVKHYSRFKRTAATCAIEGVKLSGTGNQIKSASRKKAKTTRRPSVKFGGVLSSKARKEVWENYALVKSGKKELAQVTEKVKRYVAPQIEKVNK